MKNGTLTITSNGTVERPKGLRPSTPWLRAPGWVAQEIAAARKPRTLRAFWRERPACGNEKCACHALRRVNWYEKEPGWALKNVKAELAAQSRRLAGQPAFPEVELAEAA